MSKVTADKKTTSKATTGKPVSTKTGAGGNNAVKNGKNLAAKPAANKPATNNGKSNKSNTMAPKQVAAQSNKDGNDFISLVDESEFRETNSVRSSSGQDRRASSSGDQEERKRAREQMTELEQNIKDSDADFEDQYKSFKEKSDESLKTLSDAREALDKQAEKLEESSIEELFSDVDQSQTIREEVSSTRRLLMGAQKYLSNDFMEELLRLRESLRRCVDIFSRKLKEVNFIPTTNGNVRTVLVSSAALKQLAQISVELKELESRILEILETSQKLIDEIQKSSAEIQGFENLIESAELQVKEKEQVDQEPEVQQEDKEEEQEQEEEEDENNEGDEEEELRRQRQEEEDLERQKQLEEERDRQRQLEEEERLRKEREAEERRKLDPKNFPILVYNIDEKEDNTGCGLACALRVPLNVTLTESSLRVTSLDMVTNRYQPGDNEELVSNIINVVPTKNEEMNFEIPLWLALPCTGTSRGREFSIRVQRLLPPRLRVKSRQQKDGSGGGQTPLSGDNNDVVYNPIADTDNVQTNEQLPESDTSNEVVGEGVVNNETEQQETGEENKEDNDVVPHEQSEQSKNIDKDQLSNREQPLRTRSRASVMSQVKEEIPEDDEPEPAWEDMPTKDTTVEGQESVRFVETSVNEIPAYGFNFVVILRPKKETGRFNNKGGKLVYSMDVRNSITIPKNALRLEGDVTMQVIPVDSSTMYGMKERYEDCESLIGSSPFLNISLPSKPSKSLTFTVANPSGASKSRKTNDGKTVATGGARRPTFPSLTKVKSTEGSRDMDVVNLMIKDTKGKWKHCDKVELTFTKDFTSFELSELCERLVLLRTNSELESNDLCKLSVKLELSLLERSVSVVVRQSTSDLEQMILELTRTENVEKVEQRLKDEDFTEGSDVNEQICLREGDLIEISFRDNINFEDRTSKRIVFNSNLQSGRVTSVINIVDGFAQNALENYRGYVQLNLVDKKYDAPPKLSAKKPKNAGPGFVCEIPLSLPKPVKDLTRVNRIGLPIPTEGPISEEYFDYISSELGEEWLQVAARLGHNLASIQRIQQTYAYLSGTAEGNRKCIKAMLVDWFKISKKSKNKVNELYNALLEGRRNDLAAELIQKDTELREEAVRREKETLLEKCSKAYADSPAARKSWRPVALALGLTREDIVNVGGGTAVVQELSVDQAREMLLRWQELRGDSATKDSLVVVLKRLKLNEAAVNVSMVR